MSAIARAVLLATAMMRSIGRAAAATSGSLRSSQRVRERFCRLKPHDPGVFGQGWDYARRVAAYEAFSRLVSAKHPTMRNQMRNVSIAEPDAALSGL